MSDNRIEEISMHAANALNTPGFKGMTMSRKVRAVLITGTVFLLAACGGGESGNPVESNAEPLIEAALPDATGIGFIETQIQIEETDRTLLVAVFRAGDAVGAASVKYSVTGNSATVEEDFVPTSGTLEWGDGETGVKTFPLIILSDADDENDEELALSLSQQSGSGLISAAATANVTILNSPCNAIVSGQSAGSVHLSQPCNRLTGDLQLGAGDTFSAIPGATLVADDGVKIVIGAGSSVSLPGIAEKPIVFRGVSSVNGSWAGIELRDSNAAQNIITHTWISDAAVGLNVNSGSDLTQFSHNRLLRNTLPIKIAAPLLETLDRSSQLGGNASDYVVIADGNLDGSHTIPALNVAYLSEGSIVVNGNLTIEPGTQFHFAANDLLIVSTTGVLQAIGTADAPIVFTGQQSIPGYWDGIHFSTMINNASRIAFAKVSYAGGDIRRPGNIAIYGGSPELEIGNVELTHSSGHGIWVSANQSNITTPGTTFADNAGQDVYYD